MTIMTALQKNLQSHDNIKFCPVWNEDDLLLGSLGLESNGASAKYGTS